MAGAGAERDIDGAADVDMEATENIKAEAEIKEENGDDVAVNGQATSDDPGTFRHSGTFTYAWPSS